MKTYIGVDLGGTNVRVAKITEDGEVLETLKSPSYAQEGPEKVMANIKSMIHDITDWKECSGIGVGVPGPCDQVNGTLTMSTNLPGFTGYPVAQELSDEFGMPAFIDNDANVAGLAEAHVGAGKGLNSVYYVTISTGIGGGFVLDGKTVSGKHGYAGEIANIIVNPMAKKINHLAPGAVENEASGTAVVRKAREAMPEENIQHAGQVFALADAGNEIAKKIVEDEVLYLATLFEILDAVCDPDMFVLGGGMMKSAEHFLPAVVEKYKTFCHDMCKDVQFVHAQLEEPGIIGAAMLPKSHGC